MSANNTGLLAKVEQVQARLRTMLEQACIAFANGGSGSAGGAGMGAPIVDDRFKGQGNTRFAPLSYDYAQAKAGAAGKLRKIQRKAGRVVSNLTPVAYQSSTGTITGIGSSKNLPILVRTGALRQAVTAGRARIVIVPDGSRGRVIFAGLPPYAKYHEQGSASLPVRSPVKPNAADRARMVLVMQKYLKANLPRGLTIR